MERETFKEHIREELYFFAEGMSTAMKQDSRFVNITGGEYIKLVDVTEPLWLVIIRLLHRQHTNEYDSTVTNILGGGAVDLWLKKPRERQDSIVFESSNFRSLRINVILRERNGSLWWGV